MTFGSLFSGCGGMDLGLERAGMAVRWQVENDPRCQRVLDKHWRHIERFGDIREVTGHDVSAVDLIAGGYPCQDVSDASRGRGGGIDGQQSGLWREFVRVVSEVEPRFVIVENVDGAAWRRWVPVVRGALHDIGYPSVPIRVRASDVGAPHDGSRIFLAAAYRDGESARAIHAQMAELQAVAGSRRPDWGQPSPRALGVADGVSRRMERLGMTGNAVVPACAELIGRAIMSVYEPSAVRLSMAGQSWELR